MKVLQIAHRGYSEFFKDNSIISIEKAIEYKFDMIEFDIQLTKDNKIILFHDIVIKTQNNFHFVIDLTYEEIKSINPNIILLNDVFMMFYKKKIYNFPIYIDIKGTKKIIPILLQQINRYKKFYNLSSLYFTSFNLFILDEIYKYNKNLNLGFISETMYSSDLIYTLIKNYNIKLFCCHWSALQHKEIDFLQKNNILVFTYTNTCSNIFQRIKNFNVNGIVTNYKII